MWNSVFWYLSGKLFTQGFGLVVSVILARLILPDEFGIIAMVLVIIAMSQVFLDFGFGAGLIQKENVDEDTYSSVFWFNIFMASVLTVILFILSPFVSEFYGQSRLTLITKALSSLFFVGSLGLMQSVILTKAMNFKVQSIATTIATVLSGIIAIVLALRGLEVWALVFQQILLKVFNVIILWLLVPWKPKWCFKISHLNEIWSFSSYKFTTQILQSILSKLDSIIIGKLFVPSVLGFYSRSRNLADLIKSYTSESFSKVYFPYVSNNQGDIAKLKETYYLGFKIVAIVSIGLSALFYSIADELIVILFSDIWLKSAYYFSFMIIADSFTKPLGQMNLTMLVGLGHANVELKLLLMKRTIWVLALITLWYLGIEVFLYAIIIHSFIAYLIDSYFVSKYLPISLTFVYFFLIKCLAIAVVSILLSQWIDFEASIILNAVLKSAIVLTCFLIGMYFVSRESIYLIYNKIIKYKAS
ncbi:lipopolysaccharide biosynthesis protein [Fulvivirga ulvae]|uniref:lipopolysaccharide biosynthesis protein n=1 Tax=Fulvivirga ulvae TaxID=2904245 RepID=UPI001F306D9C|nr:lipopolysaccharide biosynthesis protein [Fulvivirga ulvae]UII33380.1 lipopolysaccharide biosynthesis protein [Fulvivirga ulvae]